MSDSGLEWCPVDVGIWFICHSVNQTTQMSYKYVSEGNIE